MLLYIIKYCELISDNESGVLAHHQSLNMVSVSSKTQANERKMRIRTHTESILNVGVCAGVSSHRAWAPSQPHTPASKASQVCTRLIICIWEWYRLLKASTFSGQTTEPFLSLQNLLGPNNPPPPHPHPVCHDATLCAVLVHRAGPSQLVCIFNKKHLNSVCMKALI